MFLTLFLAAILFVVLLLGLGAIGRVALVRECAENDRAGLLIKEFHEHLVDYANSRGSDQAAFHQMALKSGGVEAALGSDNIVTGVQIGNYLLNGVPLLNLAIQEMRRAYGDGLAWRNEGGAIADAVQTVIFRHIGRRADHAKRLLERAQSFGSCVGTGWMILTALPISILSGFGLLNARRATAARGSFLFRLWNFLLAVAAISAPVLAYLADREKIDAAVRAFFQ